MKKQLIITPRFRTWYNHKEIPSPGEENSGEVITVPYQSYTIREIFEKFGNGMPLPIGHNGNYDPDPDIDNPDPYRSPDFDLADLTELQNTIPQKVETLKKTRKALELSSAGLPDAHAVEDNGVKDGVKDGRQLP